MEFVNFAFRLSRTRRPQSSIPHYCREFIRKLLKLLRFLRQILQLVLRPANGWEDIAADLGAEPGEAERVYRADFLPLISICSASSLVRILYGADFLGAFSQGLVMFVALFLSYYIACWVLASWMPGIAGRGSDDSRRYQLMVMYTLAIIALVGLLVNVVKVRMAILSFLPLYTVFVLWKGCRFAGVPQPKEGLFMLLSTACILGSFYGLSFVFNSLI